MNKKTWGKSKYINNIKCEWIKQSNKNSEFNGLKNYMLSLMTYLRFKDTNML